MIPGIPLPLVLVIREGNETSIGVNGDVAWCKELLQRYQALQVVVLHGLVERSVVGLQIVADSRKIVGAYRRARVECQGGHQKSNRYSHSSNISFCLYCVY